MPTGLFRTTDQSAQVEYDGVSIPIPRSTYEKNGYKPDFDKLPLEDEYKAAQEKLRNVKRPQVRPPRARCRQPRFAYLKKRIDAGGGWLQRSPETC